MASVDLILRASTVAANDHIDLLLGGDATAPVVIYDAVVTARLSFRGAIDATYDNAVNRGIVAQTGLVFDAVAAKAVAELTTAWNPSQFKPIAKQAVWHAAQAAGVAVRPRWQHSAITPLQAATPWQQARSAAVRAATQWQATTSTPLATRAWWDVAQPVDNVAALAFDYAKFTPHSRIARWDGLPAPASRRVVLPFDDKATARHLNRIAPWDTAKVVSSYGGPWAYVVPQNPPPYVQPRDTHLVLCCLQPKFTYSAVALVLGGDPCAANSETTTTAILPARVYMSVHQITAQLLPSGAFIPIRDVTVAADKGSFCRTFSASGHISLFDQLMPTSGLPQQIRFYIDGIGFVFIVGPVRKTEAFGKKGVQFSGRSVTALLAAPYARESSWFNSTAQTARQLAENVLQYSGVTLDWGVTDWLVPAGAWSHQGTPLSAVQAIAQAIGGYVQSHRTDPVLQVRHPYPELAGGLPGGPWNWYANGVTPDVTLAAEALMTVGTERRDEADVNGVYVSGTNQGVLALVKRIGTAGEKLAALVTDPLITANEAALQRGLSILGAAGSKHFIDFELPILTGSGEPGILDVGQLTLINQSAPWRGRVRGVSAAATFGGKVRQTINVERHLEVAQ